MFTNSFNLILYLRIFQGIGASGLVTLAATIVGDLYTGNRVPEAIGYNSSVVSFSLMVYPTIGGALALVNWHLPFILPVAAIPVGIMVIVMTICGQLYKGSDTSAHVRNQFKKRVNQACPPD
jgi:MFS transporter, ACDE family, multidrug resistance protein